MDGRVVKPGGDSVVAVPDAWVTLHRVGTDHAGPIDSTRTNRDGRFAFSYRRTGADDAIYFASSSHGGVAYFTRPLNAGDESGDDAEITVFDTTSHVIPITVRGRHLVVMRADPSGSRAVTEVFDLSNDTSVTRIASGDSPGSAVWSAIIPAGARGAHVSDGDVPAAAVQFADGRALVFAPLAPGMKQLAFEYQLASDAFPLHVPLEHTASVLEVLVEDPSAQVQGAHLHQVPPVSVEGHDFHRYLASDAPANSVVIIRVPDVAQPMTIWFVAGLTLVIGAAMTLALARALRRR